MRVQKLIMIVQVLLLLIVVKQGWNILVVMDNSSQLKKIWVVLLTFMTNVGQIAGTSMSGELKNPNFLDLGTYLNTPGILQKWLDMYEDDLETFSGESGDWSFMQTEANGIVVVSK